MFRRAVVFVAILAGTAAAKPRVRTAKPPTKAESEAMVIATKWVGAMHFGGTEKPETGALTAPKLWSIAADDEHAVCPESHAATAGLACLHDKITPAGSPRIWRHTLGGPLAAHAKQIDAIAKGGTVVEFDAGCDGTANQLLLVIKHKQVTAALAQTITCTE